MTSIIKNLEDIQYERVSVMEKEKENEKIEDYENNFTLKVSLINIDSKFRNDNPKNITEGTPSFLSNNSINTTENSYEVKIVNPNHNFKIGDKFIIQNIKNNNIILRNKFYLFSKFKYLVINLENHNYNKITLHNEIENRIQISNYEKIDERKRLIGNIPFNSIIGMKKIFTLNEITIESFILTNILTFFDITEQTLDDNYIFIELPFSYSKTNKLDNGIIFLDNHLINNIFKIEINEIGGIPLYYLNANYPINNYQYESCHFVSRIDKDNIYFNSKVKANITKSGGLNKIYMLKIINVIDGFTKADNYIIDLKKSFTDVVRIELVSTEIPFIEFNINNNVTSKNNKLYWKYLDDGENIYSITMDEGSYTPTSLVQNIREKLNNVERIGSTGKKKILSSFDMEINKSSQEVTLSSFKDEELPHSLKIIKDNIVTSTFKLEITCPNNFVKVNDNITIKGSTDIGDIPLNTINRTHTVYEINPENDTFTVLIPVDITIRNLNTEGNGGPYVKVKVPVFTSFLFNFSDTIGSLLGFKNVGSPYSITNFSHVTSNFDNYIEEIILDEVGNRQVENVYLNLTGDNFYMFMYLNDYEGIISNAVTDNAFAKIILSGYTGDIMFNTFISSPLEFDTPISILNELKVAFKYANNISPNFKNFDHSFTLRITERITKPVRTQILSKKKDYRQAMIELHTFDK